MYKMMSIKANREESLWYEPTSSSHSHSNAAWMIERITNVIPHCLSMLCCAKNMMTDH